MQRERGQAVEHAFPVDTYAPSPDRFKPVNLFSRRGHAGAPKFLVGGFGIGEEGAQFGTAYRRWLAKVRQADYDK